MMYKLKRVITILIIFLGYTTFSLNYFDEEDFSRSSKLEPVIDYFGLSKEKFIQGPCIAGVVYWDMNSNGVRDSGEPGVPGIGVMWSSSGTLMNWGLTDMTGKYSFICPYTINFQIVSGHAVSLLIPASAYVLTNPSSGVTHSPWAMSTQLNFGLKPLTSCCTGNVLSFDPPVQNVSMNQNGDYQVSICPYGKVNVNISSSCPGMSYYWLWGDEQFSHNFAGILYSNGVAVPALTSLTGLSQGHQYNTPGVYTAYIYGVVSGNCSFMRKITVNVTKNACEPCCASMPFVESSGLQNLSFFAQPFVYKGDLCPLNPVSFTATCPESNSYDWDFGDGTVINGGSSIQSHQFSTPGAYNIKVKTVSTAFCADQTQQFNVTVSKSFCDPCCPALSMINCSELVDLIQTSPGVFTAKLCAGKSINFGVSDCSNGSSFSWTFGDGGVASGANVAHNYSTPGSYVLTLTFNGTSCYQSQTINLTVIDCSCSGATLISPSGGACTDYPVALSVAGCLNPGATYNWNFGDGTTATGLSVNHVYSGVGSYVVSVTIIQQPYSPVILTSNVNVSSCPNLNSCKDCVGSFAPEPGEYIVSVWVKEDYPNMVYSYPDPAIKISFVGSSSVFGPFSPNPSRFRIIDGWQKIEEKITVPNGATSIKIDLINISTAYDCYFDDIRIHPINANLKSYVYDPVTLRLSAELDENNYATYYEYDDEGMLVRVKKETERGVMTITESRRSIKK